MTWQIFKLSRAAQRVETHRPLLHEEGRKVVMLGLAEKVVQQHDVYVSTLMFLTPSNQLTKMNETAATYAGHCALIHYLKHVQDGEAMSTGICLVVHFASISQSDGWQSSGDLMKGLTVSVLSSNRCQIRRRIFFRKSM